MSTHNLLDPQENIHNNGFDWEAMTGKAVLNSMENPSIIYEDFHQKLKLKDTRSARQAAVWQAAPAGCWSPDDWQ